MQVNANIDEADVGRIRPGQPVTFRVDAYPGTEFEGRVAQVRLQPIVVQNVTTYGTVINVPNPRWLKPGMTANRQGGDVASGDAVRVLKCRAFGSARPYGNFSRRLIKPTARPAGGGKWAGAGDRSRGAWAPGGSEQPVRAAHGAGARGGGQVGQPARAQPATRQGAQPRTPAWGSPVTARAASRVLAGVGGDFRSGRRGLRRTVRRLWRWQSWRLWAEDGGDRCNAHRLE